MSEHQTTAAGHSPTAESPWRDEPDYPHRLENHVKVYLHLEETPTPPTIADPATAPAGTRVFRRTPTGDPEYSTVTGWTTDGDAVFLDVDQGGSYAGPTFGSIYLVDEDSASPAGLRWAVSPVTVDGYPLDGVDDGHYCDYEGHPPGARPDWDRQHRQAAQVHLPTAAELLPLLAAALEHQSTGPSGDQVRDAAGLIAEHAAWRAARDELSAAEATGEAPRSSAWHASDDAGCELADRAVGLLAAMTEQMSSTPPPPAPNRAGVALMRSALASPTTSPAAPATGVAAQPPTGPVR